MRLLFNLHAIMGLSPINRRLIILKEMHIIRHTINHGPLKVKQIHPEKRVLRPLIPFNNYAE